MKNLILIFLLFPTMLFAQVVYTDSIQMSSISGSDTTIFYDFRTENGSSIQFDYTNFDAKDAAFDFGLSNDTESFVTAPNYTPEVLDSTSHTKTVNGVTKMRLMFVKNKWNTKYIAWKVTKNSVVTGTLIWKYIR